MSPKVSAHHEKMGISPTQTQKTPRPAQPEFYHGKKVRPLHTAPLAKESLPALIKTDPKAQQMLLRSIASSRGKDTADNVCKKLNLTSGDLTQLALLKDKKIATPTLAEEHWQNPPARLREVPFNATAFDADNEATRLMQKYPNATPELVVNAVKLYPERRKTSDTAKLLTLDQFAAINLYTNRQYTAINTALRSGKNYGSWSKLIADVNSGIAILKQMEGLPKKGSGAVFRGQNITHKSPSHPGRFQVGDTIVDPGFLSTTKGIDVAEEFAFGINSELYQHLFGAQGVTIEELSSSEGESEVLFPPGTEFTLVFKHYNPQTKVFKMVMGEKETLGHPGTTKLRDALLDPPLSKT